MNHYIDITILPDSEFPATVLMNAVYSKLHKALCNHHSKNIGVSFPRYSVTLGNILRLHGEESALQDLQQMNWVGGMSGYCNISKVLTVPADSKHRTISRKHRSKSRSKLNRLIKRGAFPESAIEDYQKKMAKQKFKGPYIALTSNSNGQRHKRYLVFGDLMDTPVHGDFDKFGLSKTATIPWFD